MPRSLFRWLYRSRFAPFANLPGPEPSWPLGNAAAFARGWPWERCAEWTRDHGGLYRIFLGSTPALVVSDPDLIGEILVDRWAEFHKESPVAALAPVITRDSLFISNLPAWRAAREQNPLRQVSTGPWLARLVPTLQPVLRNLVQAWGESGPGTPLALYDQTQRLSFTTFSHAFWGRAMPAEHYDWFQTLASTGSRRMALPDAINRLNWFGPAFRLARARWYDTYEGVVREARRKLGRQASPASDSDASDSPTDLLQVSLRQGTPLNDAQLAEALATNYFGGVFSCSSALNTALWQLHQSPQELVRLRQTLGRDLPPDQPWTIGALQGCEPLEHVLREALRLQPPVPMYFRSSPSDRETTLGGIRLPPGTNLFIMQWHAHCESNFWGDPHRFRPNRWEQGFAEQHPFGSPRFFPFGRGSRACIGGDFALFYLRLALATLLSELEFEFTPGSRPKPGFFFGVMMPRGLHVRCRRRR